MLDIDDLNYYEWLLCRHVLYCPQIEEMEIEEVEEIYRSRWRESLLKLFNDGYPFSILISNLLLGFEQA